MKTTLHIPGLFHTINDSRYTHCAFSTKVLRFSKMMRQYGWDVIEYSNGVTESQCSEHVQILTEDELNTLAGKQGDSAFHGNLAVIGSPHWMEFDKRLRIELKKRVKPQDVILHPFGKSHCGLVQDFKEQLHCESGIGYSDRCFGAFRIFESYAWMHFHQGNHLNYDKEGKLIYKDGVPVIGRNGHDYEFVVPNYFDMDEWTPRIEPVMDRYLLFMGRIDPIKGMDIVKEIANHTKYRIVVAGQGDITPWKHPNIEYIGPLKGRERDKWVGGAMAMLMPSRFTEPFAGSGVEAQATGTALLSSDFGAFDETVEQGKTGFRCHTLGDWLQAIELAPMLDRAYIAERARRLYSLETVGKRYDQIFQILLDLWQNGWYEKTPHLLEECH